MAEVDREGGKNVCYIRYVDFNRYLMRFPQFALFDTPRPPNGIALYLIEYLSSLSRSSKQSYERVPSILYRNES